VKGDMKGVKVKTYVEHLQTNKEGFFIMQP